MENKTLELSSIRISAAHVEAIERGELIPIAEKFTSADVGQCFYLESDVLGITLMCELRARVGDYWYFC